MGILLKIPKASAPILRVPRASIRQERMMECGEIATSAYGLLAMTVIARAKPEAISAGRSQRGKMNRKNLL